MRCRNVWKQENSHFNFLWMLNIFLWESNKWFIVIISICFLEQDPCSLIILDDCVIIDKNGFWLFCIQLSAKISSLPSGEELDLWEYAELFLLLSLLTDKLDWIFLCIFLETGAENFLLSFATSLTPLWIPLPLLRPAWPFCVLPVSSLCFSSGEAVGWGKRSGWALKRRRKKS